MGRDTTRYRKTNNGFLSTSESNCFQPGITHWQHPKFFSWFPCNSSYPGILGELYSSMFNCAAFNWICSPSVTECTCINSLSNVSGNGCARLVGKSSRLARHFPFHWSRRRCNPRVGIGGHSGGRCCRQRSIPLVTQSRQSRRCARQASHFWFRSDSFLHAKGSDDRGCQVSRYSG